MADLVNWSRIELEHYKPRFKTRRIYRHVVHYVYSLVILGALLALLWPTFRAWTAHQ